MLSIWAVFLSGSVSNPVDAQSFVFERNGRSLLDTFPFNHRQSNHDHDHTHENHGQHDELLGKFFLKKTKEYLKNRLFGFS